MNQVWPMHGPMQVTGLGMGTEQPPTNVLSALIA